MMTSSPVNSDLGLDCDCPDYCVSSQAAAVPCEEITTPALHHAHWQSCYFTVGSTRLFRGAKTNLYKPKHVQ